jgi:hypothetical protein
MGGLASIAGLVLFTAEYGERAEKTGEDRESRSGY